MDVLFWLAKGPFSIFGVILWMFHVGRARHPGPGPRVFTPGQLSIEFVNVGGWLTHGDLALDSCAQFLAVAEHKLIPSSARSGWWWSLWLLVLLLMLLVGLVGRRGTGSRRDFIVGCPNALAPSQACYVTDRWFTPHFSVFASFRIGSWMADVACPVVCQPIWSLVGWILLIGPPRRLIVLSRVSGTSIG